MKLVTIYKGHITSSKEININEFNLLENHNLILCDNNDYKKFGETFCQNVQGISDLHSVKHIKETISLIKKNFILEKNKNLLREKITSILKENEISVKNLKNACEKLITGRRMEDNEKLALELIDINSLPKGFYFVLNEI